ncbi:arginine--tRNA ligase, chloroplastic/mitochondrial [Tanacetum coccineum]
MAIPALINDDRMWSIISILNMLERYGMMMQASTTTAASKPDDDRMWSITDIFNMLEKYKFLLTTIAAFTPDDDNMWNMLNKLSWYKLDSTMKDSTSTMAPTITASTPYEDSMWTLITNLNMLERYLFGLVYSTSTIAASTPDEDDMRNIFKMKASTSTMVPTITASTPHDEDNKWCLQTEVFQLFNKALKATFPKFTEKCIMLWWKKDGVFQCENFLSIWPKIKKIESNNINKRYPHIKGPIGVGKTIKRGLMKLKSPMIEGEPNVHDVGFVTIKLSGNWMAENIHKMLRDGIDTWAPRRKLDYKSLIINSPSWDASDLMPMDVLRREFIIMSQMHMLKYVNSAAMTSSGNGMSLPQCKLDEHFRTVESDGELLLYVKDEGILKPLIRGKSRTGKSLGESDGRFGYPLEDLGALWRGLVNDKADWIVCVTPAQQQDYIENCFKAAVHAGWIPTDSFWPLATYVGFKTCSTSLEDLLSILRKDQYPCEAGEAAKLLGYTDEAVLECALTYTVLKCHRLADCKFSYNEMLDIKGDTFVYLLTTQAKIRKITNNSRKDIDELKKASNLVMEKDKVVWCAGVERDLGFHLLMFTELVNESYLSFLPNLLCRYLYDLSHKFSHFYETYVSSGFKETTRLLLCEATAAVMEKGFHLLGITQKPSLQAVSAALALNFVAPLEVLNPTKKNPHKNPIIRTRFEVFTIYLHITRDHEFKGGKVFGSLEVSDYYGLRPDGWGALHNPGPGRVSLFCHDWCDSVEIQNNGRLKIGNPSSRHSVPFSSSMRICILLYATTKKKDEFFEVCNHKSYMNFSPFLDNNSESSCEFLVAGGDDGHIRMHFVLLRDAVDATIKVKFGMGSNRRVCGEILAYYGEFDYGDDNLVKSFYKASLFESYYGSVREGGDVPLMRSVLAVPFNCSLIIEARLTDFKSKKVILFGRRKFFPHREASDQGDITYNDNTLNVEITWSQGKMGWQVDSDDDDIENVYDETAEFPINDQSKPKSKLRGASTPLVTVSNV